MKFKDSNFVLFVFSYSLYLGRMRIMLLLPFPRNAWQFGRPEKQGASACIKRIFRTENVNQNVFTANKILLAIRPPQLIT